jgi:O-antigen/teichoic acid export membrane protein
VTDLAPHPKDDRGESRDQRMDRNFVELLQELRVLQTGTQILAGFLMTLPFQARFPELSDYHRWLFLTAIVLAFATTVLLVGPVSVHRALFRQHMKAELVQVSHVRARLGLLTLGLTMATVITLIFSVVLGDPEGYAAGGASVLVFGLVWWGLPQWLRRAEDHGPA